MRMRKELNFLRNYKSLFEMNINFKEYFNSKMQTGFAGVINNL